MIYLDSAATTLQKPKAVRRAVARALGNASSAGRGGHRGASRAADILLDCREAAADLFHLDDPERVCFTANATHGLNIAIRSLVKPGMRVVISGYEHNAVYRPLAAMAPEGVEITVAKGEPFSPESMVYAFEQALIGGASAAVCTHVSNVFGYILPIERIDGLCAKYGVPLIIDAAQSAGCVPLDVKQLKATEFIAMPGHKGLYGPQGTGLLLCLGEHPSPLLYGGTGADSMASGMPDYLPDRLEAGTHNIHGIAGLLEGIRYVKKTGVQEILEHHRLLVAEAAAEFYGHPHFRVHAAEWFFCQSGVLSIRPTKGTAEEAADYLAGRGVAVRAGLHCAPLAHETAGTAETGTLRMSVSTFTESWEIRTFAGMLKAYAGK